MADRGGRAGSLGSLCHLTDKVLTRLFSWLLPSDRISCSEVSWMFWAIQDDELQWRALALSLLMDRENKRADFCFHGTWRATVLHPPRYPGRGFDAQNRGPPPRGSIRDSPDRPAWARTPVKDVQRWYKTRHENIFAWPGFFHGIERRHRLTRDEFIDQYERFNRPVIITGLMDEWPAMYRWQPHTMVQQYGDVPVRNNGRSTDGRRFRMRLFDFLAYCSSVDAEKYLYVFDKKVFNTCPELLQDFTVPDLFRDDLFALMDEEDRPDYRWLLIGPHGSATPLHTDPHRSSAWNGVICGCKRVTFYPPDVIPPGVDESLIDSEYYASDDALDWYRNVLPSLKDAVQQPIECLVMPGEIVFIPSGWWHTVINIGLTVAITQNFCSHLTFPFVANDINTKGGRNLRRDFKVALAESPSDRHLADYIVCKRRK